MMKKWFYNNLLEIHAKLQGPESHMEKVDDNQIYEGMTTSLGILQEAIA